MKTIQEDQNIMSNVITMFTDLANMNREYQNTKDDPIFQSESSGGLYNKKGFDDKETASWFTSLMSTIFGRQDFELANEIFAEALIRHGRKPNFYVMNQKLRNEIEGLENIP